MFDQFITHVLGTRVTTSMPNATIAIHAFEIILMLRI